MSGAQAGLSVAMDDLRMAKEGAGDRPVLANTGVNHDNVSDILAVADGVIVGTSLKRDGDTWNPVDPDRAARMVRLVADARRRPAAG